MGDVLLEETANRLLGCVREADTAARMGGDEFTIILTDVNLPGSVDIVAKKVLETLARPFTLKGGEHSIGSSIGIAIYPADGEDAETLVRNADNAMYRAKQQRNTYCFYSREPV
jgi:diguanylate cyclase (GGDEF)-like protein